MLRIKIMLFVQDTTSNSEKCEIANIYSRKIINYFQATPYETAKQCIMRLIKETVKRLCDDVEQTIETESELDIDCCYKKNKICGMFDKIGKELTGDAGTD